MHRAEPEPGAKPDRNIYPPARQSLAAHQAAEPGLENVCGKVDPVGKVFLLTTLLSGKNFPTRLLPSINSLFFASGIDVAQHIFRNMTEDLET